MRMIFVLLAMSSCKPPSEGPCYTPFYLLSKRSIDSVKIISCQYGGSLGAGVEKISSNLYMFKPWGVLIASGGCNPKIQVFNDTIIDEVRIIGVAEKKSDCIVISQFKYIFRDSTYEKDSIIVF